MPAIDIRHHHHQDRQGARACLDELAGRLRERYGIDTHWEDNTLRIRHLGVNGGITVDDETVHVQARLGMMMAALKPRIESELREQLEHHFGPDH